MKPDKDRALTAKERSFVEAYIVTLNGAEAVRRSAYKVAPTNASGFANKLLGRPPIKAAIEAWQRKRSLKVEFEMDDLVQELMPLAFLHPARFSTTILRPKPCRTWATPRRRSRRPKQNQQDRDLRVIAAGIRVRHLSCLGRAGG